MGNLSLKHADTRMLVCEGTACNPQLREYDQLVEQYNGGRGVLNFIKEWARQLAHTPHDRVGIVTWTTSGGWTRTFQCRVCHHKRPF